MALTSLEFLVVVAIFLADQAGLIPVTKTPVLLAVAWLSLRLRGLRWRSVGLVRPASWPRAIAVGTAAGIAMELLALFVTEPLFARLAGADPGLEEFRPLVGHHVAKRLNDEERVAAYVVEAENFESIHNHSAYALIEKDKDA